MMFWARLIVFIGIGWLIYHVVADVFNQFSTGIAVATVLVGVVMWMIADIRIGRRMEDLVDELEYEIGQKE